MNYCYLLRIWEGNLPCIKVFSPQVLNSVWGRPFAPLLWGSWEVSVQTFYCWVAGFSATSSPSVNALTCWAFHSQPPVLNSWGTSAEAGGSNPRRGEGGMGPMVCYPRTLTAHFQGRWLTVRRGTGDWQAGSGTQLILAQGVLVRIGAGSLMEIPQLSGFMCMSGVMLKICKANLGLKQRVSFSFF